MAMLSLRPAGIERILAVVSFGLPKRVSSTYDGYAMRPRKGIGLGEFCGERDGAPRLPRVGPSSASE